MSNQFAGLSTLRAAERKTQPVSESAKAMAAYLSKYTEGKRGERASLEALDGDGGDGVRRQRFDLKDTRAPF